MPKLRNLLLAAGLERQNTKPKERMMRRTASTFRPAPGQARTMGAERPRLSTFRVAAGVLAAIAALVTTDAAAQDAAFESEPDVCHEACSDARGACQKTASIAHRGCARGCRETIEQAVRQARVVCGHEELADLACRQLVQRTVKGAQVACQADCRVATRLARTVCSAERRDCRAACLGAVDPECREPCVADFEACREDFGACADVCREQRHTAGLACQEQTSEVCDPVVLRECFQQVRAEARACVEECGHDTSCGENLRECVHDCADGFGEAPDVP